MPELNASPSTTIESRLENRIRLAAMRAEIDAQLEAENDAIKEYLIDAGLDTVAVGDYTATLSINTRSTLDKTALVEAGVTTDQIKRATKTSTFAKLDVRKKKG